MIFSHLIFNELRLKKKKKILLQIKNTQNFMVCHFIQKNANKFQIKSREVLHKSK